MSPLQISQRFYTSLMLFEKELFRTPSKTAKIKDSSNNPIPNQVFKKRNPLGVYVPKLTIFPNLFSDAFYTFI